MRMSLVTHLCVLTHLLKTTGLNNPKALPKGPSLRYHKQGWSKTGTSFKMQTRIKKELDQEESKKGYATGSALDSSLGR